MSVAGHVALEDELSLLLYRDHGIFETRGLLMSKILTMMSFVTILMIWETLS